MKKIAFVTDIHLNEKLPANVDARAQWKRILDDCASRNITELVFGGDIGDPSAYLWFFDTLKDPYPNLKLLIGNHDTYSEAVKHYHYVGLGDHQELYYTYEDDALKYLVLDSSSNRVSEVQQQWLAAQLHTSKDVVLFIHHPVYGVDTAVDRQYPLQGRDAIQQLLQQSHKKIHIFCGHYHLPDEQAHGVITQSITPAASYQIRKEAADIEPYADYFAYRIIYMDGAEVDSELVLLKL